MKRMFDDFDVFGRALIASLDVDPTYPLVQSICKRLHFEPEWFAFVYVAFYNIGSGIKVCQHMPTKEDWDADKFTELRKEITHFGHERRGTNRRVEGMVSHLTAAKQFITAIKESNFIDDNATFRSKLEHLPNVGGWASFKLAEVFEKALGYDALAIPDLGLAGRDPNSNDGPVSGCRWLFGRDNEYDTGWFDTWNAFGAAARDAWGVDMGEVETVLCKWHKFMTGKYFIGHDIQEFVELRPLLGDRMYSKIMFDDCKFDTKFLLKEDGRYLDKLQKEQKNVYMNTDKILFREFASKLPKADVLQIILNL